LLVGTAAQFRSGVVPRPWIFPKQWTTSVARNIKGRDLVTYFNVILLYVEVSIVTGVLI
jgi:hypothetical protein